MSDPIRWGEDPANCGRGAEMLLRGALRPRPPSAEELARLGAAVDRIVWPFDRSWRRSRRLTTAIIACAFMLGGGTAVWALRGTWNHAPAVNDAAPRAQPARTPPLPPRPSPSIDVEVVSVSPARPIVHHRVSAPANRPPVVHEESDRPANAASSDDTLPQELALIDRARADVDTAPDRALAMLDRHRQEFPRGQLAAEREFLAVEALRRLDRLDEARRRAADLRRTYPSSSYAARATRLLSPPR